MELTGSSDYFQETFTKVVEHVHRMGLEGGLRRQYARAALEILLNLFKKTSFQPINVRWINDLLKTAAVGGMSADAFTLLLRLSAWRKEEEDPVHARSPIDEYFIHLLHRKKAPQTPGGTEAPETPTQEVTLLKAIFENVKACGGRRDGWQDEAVYGGFMAIRDIHQLGSCPLDVSSLKTLSDAMDKERPFRVRKAAYDVVQAAQGGLLRSPDLRKTLEELDFPKQLCSVVVETGRSDHKLSFLMMMEILSEDRNWYPYLRAIMDIWLPLRHEGSQQAIGILARVSEVTFPEHDGLDPPLDKFLAKAVEDEWARVPGRPLNELTADFLEPFVEVTIQLRELLFTEIDRQAILAAVEKVIPSLEKRRDDGYEGPGEDIREAVDGLVEVLKEPIPVTARRFTFKIGKCGRRRMGLINPRRIEEASSTW